MSRRPAVAGTFYSGDSDLLTKDIERCFLNNYGPKRIPIIHRQQERKGNVVGLVAPHAGYTYSGPVAAHAYNRLADDGLPETVVILGPNHHGLGEAAAVASSTNWLTPLGTVHIDTEVADAILSSSKFAQEDDEAHHKEHSIEVQIPFLQYIGGHRIKVVPISIAHLTLNDAIALANDVGTAIASALAGKNALIIASTDFSHYVTQDAAESNDTMAIDKILAMDAEGLLQVVDANSISMCGSTATATAIVACLALGATKAKKLAYFTSGDIAGDHKQVVGYCAMSMEK